MCLGATVLRVQQLEHLGPQNSAKTGFGASHSGFYIEHLRIQWGQGLGKQHGERWHSGLGVALKSLVHSYQKVLR